MIDESDTRPPFAVPAWRVDDVLSYIQTTDNPRNESELIRKTTEYLIGRHIDPLTGVGEELPFSAYMMGHLQEPR